MVYDREDIERVRAATDLVGLIEEVTSVRKRGRNVMAICPFHQEKTPSLSIDPARGLFHCFGCQASGDVFGFVEQSQGLTFTEALELLARRAGVELRRRPGAERRRGEREALVEAMEAAVEFYHRRLLNGDDAGKARAYLRQRGYDADTVSTFQLGYSPDEWDRLVRHLDDRRFSDQVMVGSGLAVKSRRGRLVDRFRGRIMFPIHDVRGDPVGFGARLLEGEGPKYLNSPETRLYAKSKLLYGLQWAKSEIVRSGYAVVVEGYTDVIAFHQAGMPLAVATCGTALGEGHLDLLRRFAERVVLAFDADEAGAGASVRGFDITVPGDLDLRVAALPAGRDPADLILEGDVQLLRKAVETSMPLLQFRLEEELRRFDLSELEARGRAVRAAAPLIARHGDEIVRHEYAVLLSRRTGVDLDEVEKAIVRGITERRRPSPPPGDARLSGQEKAERELLRLLLANHPGVRDLDLDRELFVTEEHRQAFELVTPAILALEPGEAPELGSLLGDAESELARVLRGLALDERPLADPDEVLRRLQAGMFDRRIEELRRSLEGLDPDREPETYSARFSELIALESAKRQAGMRP